MADPRNGHDEAALATAARHALHDEELVAAFADADPGLEAIEAERARALVQRCEVCRELHADLAAILGAHRASTSLATAAPRDFRLTIEDATRLRPDVPVLSKPATERVHTAPAAAESLPAERTGPFLDRLRAALRAFGRPLGGTLVAAGLVGILIGSFSLGPMPAGAPALPMGGSQAQEQVRESAAPPGDFGPAGSPLILDGRSATPDDTNVGLSNPGPLLLAGSIGLVVLGMLVLLTSGRRSGQRH